MLQIKPSNAMEKIGPELRRKAEEFVEHEGMQGKFAERMVNGFVNSIWHYLDSVFRGMDMTKRPLQGRLEAMPEVLAIEPQVILSTLGKDEPVHYYLADLAAPMNRCGHVFGTDPDGMRETCDEMLPCSYHTPPTVLTTPSRPYVVPNRKDGKVRVLFGTIACDLDNAEVASLVKHLLDVAMKPSTEPGAPGVLWATIKVRSNEADPGSPANLIERVGRLGSIEATPTGHLVLQAQGHALWNEITEHAMAKVRRLLGVR